MYLANKDTLTYLITVHAMCLLLTERRLLHSCRKACSITHHARLSLFRGLVLLCSNYLCLFCSLINIITWRSAMQREYENKHVTGVPTYCVTSGFRAAGRVRPPGGGDRRGQRLQVPGDVIGWGWGRGGGWRAGGGDVSTRDQRALGQVPRSGYRDDHHEEWQVGLGATPPPTPGPLPSFTPAPPFAPTPVPAPCINRPTLYYFRQLTNKERHVNFPRCQFSPN